MLSLFRGTRSNPGPQARFVALAAWPLAGVVCWHLLRRMNDWTKAARVWRAGAAATVGGLIGVPVLAGP